jgi:imipenem/basic amino acid-specific outer membrane pore
MELDTPLAFTETWSIEQNSFEAAVLMNQDIPDTTLVAAYIGNGNGNEVFVQNLQSNLNTLGLAAGAVVNGDGDFATYGTDGAYAIAAINNSWKPLTVQAWYYDVSKLAQAYWLQADLNIEGILVGAQYTGLTLDRKSGADGTESNALAVMAGYEMKDTFTVKAAFSQTDKDTAAGWNTATSTGQSKLYTEAKWVSGYGYVTAADTTAIKVAAMTPEALTWVKLGLCGTQTTNDTTNVDMMQVALDASKSFGPLDVELMYVYMDADNQNAGDAYNTVNAYLTLNF